MLILDSWIITLPKYSPSFSMVFGNLTLVDYMVDGGKPVSVEVNDANSLLYSKIIQSLPFSVILNLSAGDHVVRIEVSAVTRYVSAPLFANPLSSTAVWGESDPANFNVAIAPKPVIVTQQENVTCSEGSIPLAFSLGMQGTSWVG